VNVQQGDGATALMSASQAGHQEVVRALLDAQADVSVGGGDG